MTIIEAMEAIDALQKRLKGYGFIRLSLNQYRAHWEFELAFWESRDCPTSRVPWCVACVCLESGVLPTYLHDLGFRRSLGKLEEWLAEYGYIERGT